VNLTISSTATDSDFVVKVIDVFPNTYPGLKLQEGQIRLPNAVQMGGYQQLIRGEPFRAKFRNSFEKPEALVPLQPSTIKFDLPDVYHAFRRGHRLMVQVQSSWFRWWIAILKSSWKFPRRSHPIFKRQRNGFFGRVTSLHR